MEADRAEQSDSVKLLFTHFKAKEQVFPYSRLAIDATNILLSYISKQAQIYEDDEFYKMDVNDPKYISQTVKQIVQMFFKHVQPIFQSQQKYNCWLVWNGTVISNINKRKKGYRNPSRSKSQALRNIEESSLEGQIFDLATEVIQNMAKNNGIKTCVAPFEAQTQIVKMFKENQINAVVSEDFCFVHYGVPLILQFLEDGIRCEVIDLKLREFKRLENTIFSKWVKTATEEQKILFGIASELKTRGFLSKLNLTEIMEVILNCSCLDDFLKKMSGQFQQDRKLEENAIWILLRFKYQIYFNLSQGRLEHLNSSASLIEANLKETALREHQAATYIDNMEQSIKYLEKRSTLTLGNQHSVQTISIEILIKSFSQDLQQSDERNYEQLRLKVEEITSILNNYPNCKGQSSKKKKSKGQLQDTKSNISQKDIQSQTESVIYQREQTFRNTRSKIQLEKKNNKERQEKERQEKKKKVSQYREWYHLLARDVDLDSFANIAVDGSQLLKEDRKLIKKLSKQQQEETEINIKAAKLSKIQNQVIPRTKRIFFDKLEPLLNKKDITNNILVVFNAKEPSYPKVKKHKKYYKSEQNSLIIDESKTAQETIETSEQSNRLDNILMKYIYKYLIGVGAIVIIAPDLANIQIVKYWKEDQIDCVVSQDENYVNFGVPLIIDISKNNKYKIIEVSKPTSVPKPTSFGGVSDSLLTKWMTQREEIKMILLGIFGGSEQIDSFPLLKLDKVIELLLSEQDLSRFWAQLKEEVTKNDILDGYFKQFDEALENIIFGVCFSKKHNKPQFLYHQTQSLVVNKLQKQVDDNSEIETVQKIEELLNKDLVLQLDPRLIGVQYSENGVPYKKKPNVFEEFEDDYFMDEDYRGEDYMEEDDTEEDYMEEDYMDENYIEHYMNNDMEQEEEEEQEQEQEQEEQKQKLHYQFDLRNQYLKDLYSTKHQTKRTILVKRIEYVHQEDIDRVALDIEEISRADLDRIAILSDYSWYQNPNLRKQAQEEINLIQSRILNHILNINAVFGNKCVAVFDDSMIENSCYQPELYLAEYPYQFANDIVMSNLQNLMLSILFALPENLSLFKRTTITSEMIKQMNSFCVGINKGVIALIQSLRSNIERHNQQRAVKRLHSINGLLIDCIMVIFFRRVKPILKKELSEQQINQIIMVLKELQALSSINMNQQIKQLQERAKQIIPQEHQQTILTLITYSIRPIFLPKEKETPQAYNSFKLRSCIESGTIPDVVSQFNKSKSIEQSGKSKRKGKDNESKPHLSRIVESLRKEKMPIIVDKATPGGNLLNQVNQNQGINYYFGSKENDPTMINSQMAELANPQDDQTFQAITTHQESEKVEQKMLEIEYQQLEEKQEVRQQEYVSEEQQFSFKKQKESKRYKDENSLNVKREEEQEKGKESDQQFYDYFRQKLHSAEPPLPQVKYALDIWSFIEKDMKPVEQCLKDKKWSALTAHVNRAISKGVQTIYELNQMKIQFMVVFQGNKKKDYYIKPNTIMNYEHQDNALNCDMSDIEDYIIELLMEVLRHFKNEYFVAPHLVSIQIAKLYRSQKHIISKVITQGSNNYEEYMILGVPIAFLKKIKKMKKTKKTKKKNKDAEGKMREKRQNLHRFMFDQNHLQSKAFYGALKMIKENGKSILNRVQLLDLTHGCDNIDILYANIEKLFSKIADKSKLTLLRNAKQFVQRQYYTYLYGDCLINQNKWEVAIHTLMVKPPAVNKSQFTNWTNSLNYLQQHKDGTRTLSNCNRLWRNIYGRTIEAAKVWNSQQFRDINIWVQICKGQQDKLYIKNRSKIQVEHIMITQKGQINERYHEPFKTVYKEAGLGTDYLNQYKDDCNLLDYMNTRNRMYATLYEKYQVDSATKKTTTIGIDALNFYTEDLVKLKRQCSYLDHPKNDKSYHDIRATIEKQGSRIINNFFNIKMKEVLDGFTPENCYFVFDGHKLEIKKNRILEYETKTAIKHQKNNPLSPSKSYQDKQEQIQANSQCQLSYKGIEKEDRNKNNFYTPKLYWVLANQIFCTIVTILRQLGCHVLVAPYEADSTLVKLRRQRTIRYVYSEDYGFINFGVPVIKKMTSNEWWMADLNTKPKQNINNLNLLLQHWMERTSKNRECPEDEKYFRLILFQTLTGSKYLKKALFLQLWKLLAIVMRCDDPPEFFYILQHEFPQINFNKNDQTKILNIMSVFMYQKTLCLNNKLTSPLTTESKGVFRIQHLNTPCQQLIYSLDTDLVGQQLNNNKYHIGHVIGQFDTQFSTYIRGDQPKISHLNCNALKKMYARDQQWIQINFSKNKQDQDRIYDRKLRYWKNISCNNIYTVESKKKM